MSQIRTVTRNSVLVPSSSPYFGVVGFPIQLLRILPKPLLNGQCKTLLGGGCKSGFGKRLNIQFFVK
jgi:hypothetical protein